MRLILLAAAAWSVWIGARRAFALSRRPQAIVDVERLAEWVSALTLVVAGLWAWQTRSWIALLAGYALGWAVQWYLPVARSSREPDRAV